MTAQLVFISSKRAAAWRIVQDPHEALAPNMPRSALETVDIDFCLPVRQIADVLVQLVNGKAANITEPRNEGTNRDGEQAPVHPTSEPAGDQIPVSCPDCNGPLYEVKHGELALFECFREP